MNGGDGRQLTPVFQCVAFLASQTNEVQTSSPKRSVEVLWSRAADGNDDANECRFLWAREGSRPGSSEESSAATVVMTIVFNGSMDYMS